MPSPMRLSRWRCAMMRYAGLRLARRRNSGAVAGKRTRFDAPLAALAGRRAARAACADACGEAERDGAATRGRTGPHERADQPDILTVSASTSEPARETIALAVLLLRQIAEDPLLRSSHRLAARRHLRRLFPPAERVVAAVGGEDW